MSLKKFLAVIIFMMLFTNCAYCDFGGYSGGSDRGGSGGREGGGNEHSNSEGYSNRGSRHDNERTRNNLRANSNNAPAILNERDKKTDWGGVIFIGCAVGVFGFLIARSNKRKRKNNFMDTSENLKTISEYCALNPDFDPQKIITWANALYIKLQETWTAGNIEPVRDNLTPEFFNIMHKRLNALISKNQTDYTDDITILQTNLKGWQRFHNNDYLILQIRTRIKSYILDNQTGRLISGSKTAEKFMFYEWTLTRKIADILDKNNDWVICNIQVPQKI